MNPTRKINRRSFFGQVAGGVVFGGGAISLVTGTARAQNTRYSGVTDSDTGEHADRPGYGTGNRNQWTDRDTGPNADAQFHGRGPNVRSEGAPSSPQSGGQYGAVPTYCSDNDLGCYADPGGRGRRCDGGAPESRSRVPTNTRHCTDSDRGGGADPVQEGRHC